MGGNEDYCGKYNGTLYPGMTMEALIRHAKELRIVNGSLIVDGDYGLSFSLPAPYDEIADVIQQIPLDLPLNEIYVCDHSAPPGAEAKEKTIVNLPRAGCAGNGVLWRAGTVNGLLSPANHLIPLIFQLLPCRANFTGLRDANRNFSQQFGAFTGATNTRV